MATVPAAYPFIEVKIDTSALQPVAQRAPGVIAVVGITPDGADGGTAALNTPFAVDTLAQAAALFAKVADDKTVTETRLYTSLKGAMLQDPKPSKIYGVRVKDDYAAGLAALEALDDVTFVSLANETSVNMLKELKSHVENMSSQGYKRIGVAMVDPTTARSNTYAKDVTTAVSALQSSASRMVVIAARGAVSDPKAGAVGDVATAAMAAIAGYEPQVSTVLKRVRGVSIPKGAQYGPTEIKDLSEAGIIPLIQPALIVGGGFYFAEGRTFTTDASLLYIDIVRTLDDIDFRLKAGLIGLIGDARITKPGLILLKSQTEGILGPLQRRAVIDGFSIDIPVLNVLSIPEAARTPTDTTIVTEARANRTVDMFVSVTYGPAVHQLRVTLAPKF
ncbi:hypothetical protein [Aquisphaera insulae]|uniref:hypothetical protein n=1 Tax=Aquisphaera insulae TaxID=2712864 RepID=UPI0013ECABC6|nr:hypothetical protein [Aquisphaera insulae]